MTIVNHATGEITETLTKDEARRLTDRIRLIAESLAEQIEKMSKLIDEARIGSAWLALGYRSWTEYVAEEFAGVLPKLDREPRREFVRELANRGMSTRAIAPVAGVGDSTVQRDLARAPHGAPVADATPQSPEAEAVRPVGGETDSDLSEARASAAPTSNPRPPVVGTDGKVYNFPTKPRVVPTPAPVTEDFTEQDHAEELAKNLSRNLSLLFALTNPERRAEYIATWRNGVRDVQPLGWDFVDPQHMRDLSAALLDFATEWENANV